ncbi:hypothetical protein [Aurantiacibacter sediminis]|uniref:DUF1073 domain-containing protein n=1 Tax=Aurantiacibacter sediminis TaxID=2793064 RepID=A0ABS0N3A7_9SPHN|nr:hypothetical protein [Aurantiacibacter sediminis]MBH5322453.1 hypothetical protein [Aurantiacibacter sediminis]
MPGSINFTEGQLRDSIRHSFHDLSKLGPIPGRVFDYLAKGEVDASKATDDVVGLQKSMWSFLQSRGAQLGDQQKFDQGDYDEILFSAYDNALRERSGDGADPLGRVNNTDPSSIGSGWDFSVDTFDTIQSQGVLPESIRAAGAIDYVYVMGERLRIFDIAEELVLGWANGSIDIAEGAAAGRLYRYWKQLDDRMPPQDRAMLYRRVLDKGSAEAMSGAAVNTNFPVVWNKLLAEIADYIEKSERIESGLTDVSPISAKPIHQAMRELQYNLTEHCTGMAFMQVREMYAQLQDAIAILKDPDIIASFGGVRRRNLWTVITEIWRDAYGTTPPVSPLVKVAVDGNRMFQLAADFEESTFTPDDLSELVQAGENYIINAAMAEGTGDTTGDSPGEDDFDPGGFDDEFDDF